MKTILTFLVHWEKTTMAVILTKRVTTVREEIMMMIMGLCRELIMTRMIVMMEMMIVITDWRTEPRTDNVTCSWGLGPHLG